MKIKTIVRLAIFNENFWSKGLIYTQNILPIITLMNNCKGFSFEIIAFISLLDIIRFRKNIKVFIKDNNKLNIKTRIFPTLYLPSRVFYPRWFLLPFLFINMFLYVMYFRLIDKYIKHKLYYNLRSYEIALAFHLFYGNTKNLIFDPRTDMITELTNAGVWKINSISYKLWMFFEKIIINKSYKSIFISRAMMDDLLNRCGLSQNDNKFYIYYNQVDFKHFKKLSTNSNNIFLYTGSLGNWNNIRNYLMFLKKISIFMKDSMLYIVTSTRPSKYEVTLHDSEFDSIRNNVVIYYNPDYNKLPEIYSNCNYGLQLMDSPDSRLGVKFVEYIATGLIPIVNENVRGAASFIRTYSIGFVVDCELKNIDSTFCEKLIIERRHNTPIPLNVRQLIDINESYKLLCNVYD